MESHRPLVVNVINDAFSCCKQQSFIDVCVKSSKERVCLVRGLSDASLRLVGVVVLCHMHHKCFYTVCLKPAIGLFLKASLATPAPEFHNS